MKQTIMDRAIDLMLERSRLVRAKLQKQYKTTKPFRMEPMSNEEALNQYMGLTPDDMRGLIDRHGEDEVNQMVMEMETLKRRKYA